MYFSFNNVQHYLSNLIYFYLVVQSFLMVKDIRAHQLLHDGLIKRLRLLCYAFTILLLVKLTVTVVHLAGVQITQTINKSDAYSVGFNAGYYFGYCTKSIFQNLALMFAVGFIWLLATVFKLAIKLKHEQDLTI